MAGPRKHDILFVFEGRKKQSKRDRELNIAAIRSHAARHTKRKKRDEARSSVRIAQIEHACLETPLSELPIHVPAQLPSIPALLSRKPAVLPNPSLRQAQADDFLGKHAAIPSALSILGQGRTDPFASCFTATLPQYIVKYLDFAYEVAWPSTTPLTREKMSTWWWRRNPFNEPHSVDHQVAGAAALAVKYDADPIVVQDAMKIRASHRRRSILWINAEIDNACGPPADRVIMAVVSIMTHTRDRDISTYHGYRQTPLATAHSLHIYGSCTVLPEDLRFLWRLVELKGGMDCIESVAVRSTLTLLDLVFATRHASRPVLKLEDGFADLAGPQPVSIGHLEGISATSCLGKGFESISDQPLLKALQACCELTVDLEHFRLRLPSSPSFGYLAHRRLNAQHALLDLDLDHDPLSETGDHSLDDVVRLAALLYSDIVLFAMPPAAGVRSRLLRDLRTALEGGLPETLSKPSHNVWLWAIMMGAVGSIMNSEESSWYVSMLRQQSFHDSIQLNWSSLKNIVTRFLWWEHILDPPAFDVWSYMKQLHGGEASLR